jgi:hypothetical protein
VVGLVALRVVSVGGLKCVNKDSQCFPEPMYLTPSIDLLAEGLEASLPRASPEGVSAPPECILSP